MSTLTLTLTYIGNDGWDRPVYSNNGRLYVDVSPIGSMEPGICTKRYNQPDGEPDEPIDSGTEIQFISERIVWR